MQCTVAAARIQQPQVIVDLRRRRHRRARIARGVFLLDGDGRRQPVDLVHIRLLNPLQKLPRIGRKRLHIPPLSLGINRVEGQRTLARSRHAADHRQLAVRNLAGEVFQVVRPRAADDDGVVQREGTGEILGRATVLFASVQAQPSILLYGGAQTFFRAIPALRLRLAREFEGKRTPVSARLGACLRRHTYSTARRRFWAILERMRRKHAASAALSMYVYSTDSLSS